MSTTHSQPKLTCPHCEQKIRFKTQPPEGAKAKCPNCHGYIIYATSRLAPVLGTDDLASQEPGCNELEPPPKLTGYELAQHELIPGPLSIPKSFPENPPASKSKASVQRATAPVSNGPASFPMIIVFIFVVLLSGIFCSIIWFSFGNLKGTARFNRLEPPVLDSGNTSQKPPLLSSAGTSEKPVPPKTFEAWLAEGRKALDNGDKVGAVASFTKALELDESSADAYNLRGVAYLRLFTYDRSMHDFNKAIELSPRAAKFYGNRAIIYDDKSDYDRALSDLTEAIKLEPKNPQWYTERGRIYRLKNEDQLAALDLEMIKKLTIPKDVLELEGKQKETHLDEVKRSLVEAMMLQEKDQALVDSIKAKIEKLDINVRYQTAVGFSPAAFLLGRQELIDEMSPVVTRLLTRMQSIESYMAELRDKPNEMQDVKERLEKLKQSDREGQGETERISPC